MKNFLVHLTILVMLCFSLEKTSTGHYGKSIEQKGLDENIAGTSPMAAVNIPGLGLYLFRGSEYYKYEMINNERVLLAGYPKKLPGGWQGLPDSFLSGIDAAVYHPPSETTFFFKGSQYVRLKGIKVMEGFPRKLPGGWQSLPSGFSEDIDAAMYYPGEDGVEGHIILVKGNKYVSYKNFKLQVLDGNVKDLWNANLPSPFNIKIDAMLENPIGTFLISGNNYVTALGNKLNETSDGLSFARRSQVAFGGINSMNDWHVKLYNLAPPDYSKISADAGVYIPDMGTYIFADDKYYKYTPDLSGKKEPKLANGYPLALPGNWQGLPKEFHADIDAAFYIGNKKTYLIKGNQYLRITGRKVDEGYPRTFPGNWEGLPKSFYSDIDAAFTVGGEGKTYVILVKNKSFVAFHNWKKVASGSTKDLFKGLPKGYNNEIQAAIGLLVGQTLFSGDQSMVALHGYATEGASFSLKELPQVEPFYEARPADLWKLPVRKRPFKSSANGNNDGIDIAVLPESSKEKPNRTEKKDEPKEEGNYECVTTHVDEKLVSPEQVLLNPTSEVIWLGAIVDGTSIPTGEYKLLSFPRNPYTIKINNVSQAKIASATISNTLAQSHINDNVNKILRSIPRGQIPNLSSSYKEDEVYSEKQFRLSFGGSYNAGLYSISAGMSMSSTKKKHRLVIEFAQKCFTMSMDDIGSYKQWIKDPSNIDFYNTMPMYVSSITYGRRAYMSIESDESIDALSTYFSGRYTTAEIEAKLSKSEVIKNSTVKVYIAGGDPNKAAAGITGNYNDFLNYIKTAPQTDRDVVPVSYTMKFLKDKSNAKVSLTSKYAIRNCTANQLKWKLTVDEIGVAGNADLYGSINISFCNNDRKKVKEVRGIWDVDAGQATTHKSIIVGKAVNHEFKDKNELKGAYVRIEWHYVDKKTLGNEHWNGSKEIFLSDVSDGIEKISIPTYNKDLQVTGNFTLQSY
ncbi:hemopexin repeat-containing protein [Maribacter algicola]|uniref:Hemopexin repeat-containing protein n=1 Tax=Meishania litoralis TaxID=3434685 RepID=A0ACC7LM87_9FLAO